MYIAPRPTLEDDPLFAIRLACAAAAGFIAAIVFQSTMTAILPALSVGMVAGQRKAFNPKKALAGPVAMALIILVMETLVTLTRAMPLVLITLMGALYTLAYYLILRTGNPIGMLIAIVTVLMSTMGMYSLDAMNMLADSFLEACVFTFFLVPVLFTLFPPRSRELMVEDYRPAPGGHYGRRAAIRGGVLLLLSFWLYAVLDASNLIYAVVAVFVMVFPTRQQLYAEVKERSIATLLGGALALGILGILVYAAHIAVLIILLLLAGLLLGSRMIDGRHPPMVYQFAFSVTLALVATSLTTQAPWDATLLRVSLTIIGALAAAVLTSLLEQLLLPGEVLAHSHPPR
jgi:hypothetical protein